MCNYASSSAYFKRQVHPPEIFGMQEASTRTTTSLQPQRRVLLGGQREDVHCRVAIMRRSLKSSKWMIEL